MVRMSSERISLDELGDFHSSNANPEGKTCGTNRLPFTEVFRSRFNGDELLIQFGTDHGVTNRGTAVHYDISDVPGNGLCIVIEI